MSFLYPSILFFTGLISLPIIIHLFRFRKFRIVYFSNLRFLRDATLETRSRSKLKHLLVLLCRILAILTLVLAFSQPFIPGGIQTDKKNNIIAIYIDNSFSMQAPGEKSSLLEEIKNAALDIIQAYPPSSKFVVISNDFEAWSNHLLSKDKAIEMIATINPSRLSYPFAQIHKRISTVPGQQDNIPGTYYLLSDFQQKDWQFNNEISDRSASFVTYKPASTPSNNLSIDTCYFEYPGHYPGSKENLAIRIRNFSAENYQNIPVRLYLNDSLTSLGNISVQAGSSAGQVIAFTSPGAGIIHGKVEISDHPITYDNTLYFSYNIAPYINVACIGEKNSPANFDAFFKNDSAFRYKSFGLKETDYSILKQQSLIIMNETGDLSDGFVHEIESYIKDGGNLLYVPSFPYKADRVNSFLSLFGLKVSDTDTTSQTMYSFNENSVLFRNSIQKKQESTTLPRVGPVLSVKYDPSNSQAVASSVSGIPLITETKFEKGKVYTLSFSLSGKGAAFATDPLFVPFLYNLALYSQPVLPLYVGQSEFVTAPLEGMNEKPAEIMNIETGNRNIPLQSRNGSEIKIFPDAQNLAPGNYNIIQNEKAAGGFSVNSDRSESENRFFSTSQIDSLFLKNSLKHFNLDNVTGPVLTRNIQHFTGGIKLWYYFIIAALFFLLAEIVILRKM